MLRDIFQKTLPPRRALGRKQQRGLRKLRSTLLDLRSILLTAGYRYTNQLRRHTDGSIVMLHTGRVGSTVVAEQLQQNPNLRWDGEVFERVLDYRERGQIAEFREILAESLTPEELIRARQAAAHPHRYGLEIKVHPNQHLRGSLLGCPLQKCIQTLHKLDFKYFIYLNRKNYLRQLISAKVASVTKQHMRRSGRPQLTRITLDPNNLFGNGSALTEEIHLHGRIRDEVVKNVATEKLLLLDYSDDVKGDPSIAYRKICEHVDIPYLPVNIELKRTNPFPISEILANYDEIAANLKETEYEWMLNENAS